jgi:DNA-binding NarL/FixJ family response regulator
MSQSGKNFVRRVLIVDDEPMIRLLLQERLQTMGYEVETAADALSAKRAVAKFDPDALVVDLDLGEGPTGPELIAALEAKSPALGFVLLTNYVPTPGELKAARRMAYLNKRDVEDVQMVAEAVNSVLRLTDGSRPEAPASATANNPLAALTKGQLAILELIAKGLSNSEIARTRSVGIRSVEQAIYRLYKSLGINRDGTQNPRAVAARIYSANHGLRQPKR